jgi:hypothetical protein
MPQLRIDPRYAQFALDTCAFDPKYSPEHQAAEEIWKLYEEEVLSLVLAHSNQREIDHPNTPPWVKTRSTQIIYTLPVSLTHDELRQRDALLTLLRGNSTSNKHDDDALHIFEASKHGSFFLTTDQRILGLSERIRELCSVQVMKPSEALARINSRP